MRGKILASALALLSTCSPVSAERHLQDDDTCPNLHVDVTDRMLVERTAKAAMQGCFQGGLAGLWLQFNTPSSYMSELKSLALNYDAPYRFLEEKQGFEAIAELTQWHLPSRTITPSPRLERAIYIGYGLGAATCGLATGVLAPHMTGWGMASPFLKQIFFPRLERIHTIAHITEKLMKRHQSNVSGVAADLTSTSWADRMYAGAVNVGFSLAGWRWRQTGRAAPLSSELLKPEVQLNPVFFAFEAWILWSTLHDLKPTTLAAWLPKNFGEIASPDAPWREMSDLNPPDKNSCAEPYAYWPFNFSWNKPVDSFAGAWLLLTAPLQVWGNLFNLHSILDLIRCLRLQKTHSSMPNLEKLTQCLNPLARTGPTEDQTSP